MGDTEATFRGHTLPSGTVTFLFTDIEGSTKLAQQYPDRWETLRARHHAILQSAIDGHNGYVFQIIGDAFCVAFHTANGGLNAAIDAQRKLKAEDWGETPIKVRMGLHTGAAEFQGNDYRGYLTMAKVQRIMSTAYGGQVLLSNASAELLRGQLPKGISLRDMNENRLKGFLNPERLWQLIASDLVSDFPPLQTLNAIPTNLPIQLTSFIGREKEIAEVKQSLSTTCLLTLTGSGGTGKTRLSLEVASEVLDVFKNGVWFIELAPLTDPTRIPQAVAAEIGLREEQGRSITKVLLDYLTDKTTLLILDNCEHLIQGCAQFAETILRVAPKVKILTSSREPLNIGGETTYRVPSLTAPNPQHGTSVETLTQYDAVRLFVERAKAVMPSFEVNSANAPAVAQICYRLDGIPLAIELAAARVRGMRVEQIMHHLDDRFRLLMGGARTALPRHQTLRALVDWSHSLLCDSERILFRRLSVFAGGWTIEATEAVCAGDGINSSEVLDLLLHLVDKSLIFMDEQSEETRYSLLETVHQYAREKLVESEEEDATCGRHLDYFIQLAEDNETRRKSPDQMLAYQQMRIELDNFRVALDWSFREGTTGSNCEKGLRLANAIDWEEITISEGLNWLQKGLPQIQRGNLNTDLIRAKTLTYLARLLVGNESQTAIRLLQESLSLYQTINPQDKRDWVYAYLALAFAHLDSDYSAARANAEAGVALARSLGSGADWDLGWALYWDGCVAYRQKDFETARVRAQEALDIFRRLGDNISIAGMLELLGWIEMKQENYKASRSYLEEAYHIYFAFDLMFWAMNDLANIAKIEQLEGRFDSARVSLEKVAAFDRDRGDKLGLARVLCDLGDTLFHLGEIDQAAQTLRESLHLLHNTTDPRFKGYGLFSLAKVLHHRGNIREAARLLGAIEVETRKELWKFNSRRMADYTQSLEVIKAVLGEETFAIAYAEGRSMTTDEAIAFVLDGPRE